MTDMHSVVKAALAGWTLGAPLQGRSEFTRLGGFQPIPLRMAPSEALDCWIVWANHVKRELPPEALALTAYDHFEFRSHESAFGQSNLRRGLTSPVSGAFDNPLASGSEAIARALFWGLVFPGDPDSAAKFSYFDASIDHSGDGLRIPVSLAVAVSQAEGIRDTGEFVSILLDALPADSKLHKASRLISSSVGNPEAPRELVNSLPKALGIEDRLDAVLSACWILIGLLHGRGDAGKSMLLTAGCGGASSQTTTVTAALLTLSQGSIASEWTEPLGATYIASSALRHVTVPEKIDDFCSLVHQSVRSGNLVQKPGFESSLDLENLQAEQSPLKESESKADDSQESETYSGSENSPEAESDESAADGTSNLSDSQEADSAVANIDMSRPVLLAETRQLMVDKSWSTLLTHGDVNLSVEYIDEPTFSPGRSQRLQICLRNTSDRPQDLELSLTASGNWEIATKLTSQRLNPGHGVKVPTVIKPLNESALPSPPAVTMNGINHVIPAPSGARFYVAGPFANPEGTGFEQANLIERERSLSMVYNGRSDMPVKWQKAVFSHHVIDVEPLFKEGVGVAYLWSRFKWPKAGRLEVLAAVETGLKLWIDGRLLIRYHDHVKITNRPLDRHSAEFETPGESEIFIKIMRGYQPVSPLTLVFYGDDGRIVLPLEFLELE
ncbi:ADP-ribosylglycohydrolase family protein [Kamptonema cortianum]|nr:ADP-ribosylglycohydrolase family protein [Geitlerinema splendidum]MDK3156173.1 ADP-ribosylglycohydrolase family protein [Kamptonema cortianum]